MFMLILTSRRCLPYLEKEPRKDILVTIANTESSGDVKYVHDTILRVNEFKHSQDYMTITKYILECVNIQD